MVASWHKLEIDYFERVEELAREELGIYKPGQLLSATRRGL